MDLFREKHTPQSVSHLRGQNYFHLTGDDIEKLSSLPKVNMSKLNNESVIEMKLRALFFPHSHLSIGTCLICRNNSMKEWALKNWSSTQCCLYPRSIFPQLSTILKPYSIYLAYPCSFCFHDHQNFTSAVPLFEIYLSFTSGVNV